MVHNPPPPRKRQVTRTAKLSLLMLGMASAIFIVSCRKEPTSPFKVETAMKTNVTPRIKAFINRSAMPPGAKSNVQLTTDSAEWYVEAALNYTLSETYKGFEYLERDSLVHTIRLDNGMVDEQEVIAVFDELKDKIEGDLAYNGMHLFLVDVVGKEERDELVFTTYAYYGHGDDNHGQSEELNIDFEEEDAWLWGGFEGYGCECGPNPTWSDQCAHRQIQIRIANGSYIAVPQGYYITNVETWDIGGLLATNIPAKTYDASYFTNPSNNSGKSNQDYLSYICFSDLDCSTCLEHDDLSHHTQGTYDIRDYVKQIHCPTKLNLGSWVTWGLGSSSGGSMHFHDLRFIFGHIGGEVQ